MGAVEEGGKVASGFISALGSQPVLLVQSLIIAGVVFILYAQGTRSFTEREQLLKSVFDAQTHVREILSSCIVPPDERKRGQLGLPKRSVVRLQSDASSPLALSPKPAPIDDPPKP
jgi:hypothetical protein